MKIKRLRLIAAFVFLVLLTGCVEPDTGIADTGSPTSSSAVIYSTPEPVLNDAPDIPTPTEPENPPDPNAKTKYDELMKECLPFFAGNNGFTLQKLFRDGSVISSESPLLWEYPTALSVRTNISAFERLAAGFKNIDCRSLSEDDARDCSFLCFIMEHFAELEPFIDYIQPLDPESGFLCDLLEDMPFFRIETEEDANYLLNLLCSFSDVTQDIYTNEKNRADNGYFLSAPLLEEEISKIDMLIEHSGTELGKIYKDAISASQAISKKKKTEIIKKISAALKTDYIPALKELKNQLIELKPLCTPECSLYEEEAGKEFFEWQVKVVSGSDCGAEEQLRILESSAEDLYLTILQLKHLNGNKISYGKWVPSKKLGELRNYSIKRFPRLDDCLDTRPYSKAEATFFGDDVVYRQAPVDTSEKSILLYKERKAEPSSVIRLQELSFLGRNLMETYGEKSIIQKLINCSIKDGWPAFSVERYILNTDKASDSSEIYSYAVYLLYEDILPACASFYVNYFGYTEAEVRAYLAQYDPGAFLEEGFVSAYQNAVQHPFNHIAKALGYSQLNAIMKDMSSFLGAGFSEKAAMEEIARFAPCGYDMLREHMFIWADSLVDSGNAIIDK